MFKKIINRFGLLTENEVKRQFATYKKQVRTSHAAAATSNLYSSWTTTNYSADKILRMDLPTLRARSRELERNNSFAKRVFGIIDRKAVGRRGFTLQARTRDDRGELHEADNILIETKFKEWRRKENCDVTGQLSFRDIQKQTVHHIMRDGEVIIRRVKFFDNKFAYALQMLEADHLDHQYNETLPSGNKVKMGIEFNKWGRPVAYHLLKDHPGDYFYAQYARSKRVRIPADEILHLYLSNRISASRGIPVIHAAMTELNMGGGYMENEIVSARVAAGQMGFITNEEGEATTAFSDASEGESNTGNKLFDIDPGGFRELGPGQSLESFKPEHPTTQFEAFMKFVLKAVASGSEVSYHALANDLRDVNYSSLRAGEVEQRDVWHDLHEWLIEHLLTPVYEDWLLMSLTSGALPVKFTLLEKFKNVKWQPRGFQWVDPRAEAISNSLSISNRIRSPQSIIRDLGDDPTEVLDEFEVWQKELDKRNITTKTEAEIAKLEKEAVKEENEN